MLFLHMAEILVVGFKIKSIKNTKMLFGSKNTAIGYLHFFVPFTFWCTTLMTLGESSCDVGDICSSGGR